MSEELQILKERVCEANLELVANGLVIRTWGNVSAVNRELSVIAIKPSGIGYDELEPDAIVIVDLKTGEVKGENSLNPSSDTPTHLELYRVFPEIGGIVHTHSGCATSFAQAGREIPCFGTTHADYFYGSVPLTRKLTPKEISDDYEANTGKVIAETWKDREAEIMNIPAVLVAQHGPFTWGPTPEKAVENAVVLEEVAKMAYATISLTPDMKPVSKNLLDKHFLRKHGKNAYYGQG